MRTAHFTCFALILVLAGCYHYTPVRPDMVPVGKDVRVQLSSTAESRLGDFLPVAGRVLEGTVLQTSGTGLLLHVPVTTPAQPGDMNLRQRIELPREEIAGLELKQLDRTRTGLVLAAVGAGVLAVVIKVLRGRTYRSGDRPVVDGSESQPTIRW